MTPTAAKRFTHFRDFYPFYLSEHRNRTCRRLHFAGSSGALIFLAVGVTTGRWPWFVAAVVSGYGLAWVGHFAFEKNRPASFRQPLFSFLGDWAMYGDILRGRVTL